MSVSKAPLEQVNGKMKKVICTVTNDLVYDQRMQRIGTTLQNHNFAVKLLGRKLKNSPPLSKFPYQQTRIKCLFNKSAFFYAEYNIRMFFYLLFSRFDIVCGCDLDTLPAAILAARLRGKKVVYDAHEYFPESPELMGKPMRQSIWRWFEKITVNKADAVYTVTQSIATLFKEKYDVECEVIRNLPLRMEPQIYDAKENVLLYQGAVNVGRGLDEMLEVMQRLEGAEFWIAGDGDEMNRIKHSVKEKELENKVKILGRKKPEELKEITQKACIGVNLLENRGLSYYFSLGNKTFDYIQAAKPQILIGFPEYVALNKEYEIGVVVDELEPQMIYDAIHTLMDSPEIYRELQQNCLRASEALCWENEEPKLLHIYNTLSTGT